MTGSGMLKRRSRRDAVVDRLADEVGDEAAGDRHEVGELDDRHGSVLDFALSWRQTIAAGVGVDREHQVEARAAGRRAMR